MTESNSRFSSEQRAVDSGPFAHHGRVIPFGEELTATPAQFKQNGTYAQKPNPIFDAVDLPPLRTAVHGNKHHKDASVIDISSIQADLDSFWPKPHGAQVDQHDFNFDVKLANNVEARNAGMQNTASQVGKEVPTPSQPSLPPVFPAKDDFKKSEHASVLLETEKNPSTGPVIFDKPITGGRMADLSAYRDLSKAPMSFGDDDMSLSPSAPMASNESAYTNFGSALNNPAQSFAHQQESLSQEVDTEFSGNVKTLIRLVNELPEGVTKQTGAQIIRLTMEAMGISMENVLSEAQSAQSEMLDAVRANIKKIEEYKTVIRKLETDIKYYQGKANELSEIIDLFILSNTSGQKVPFPDDLSH